jgi:hypothetical protein
LAASAAEVCVAAEPRGTGRNAIFRTYRVGVAMHRAYGKTYEQIREHLLIRAALVDGTLCPICSNPMFRHYTVDLHRPDAAGR